MKLLHGLSFLLVIVGALNWGLVAIGNYMDTDLNVVNMLLGAYPSIETVVYLLVGIAAIVLLFTHKRDCRMCNVGGM